MGRGDAQLYLRLPRPGEKTWKECSQNSCCLCFDHQLPLIQLLLAGKKKHDEKIWDHAGGMIIVEEAGGKVTDIFGKPLDFSRGTTLIDNTGASARETGAVSRGRELTSVDNRCCGLQRPCSRRCHCRIG